MADAPVRVGELRPSQLLWAFGCGAVVDLPQLSVVVMGLDHWDPTNSVPVGEERLLSAVRRTLGPQVARLLGAPTRRTEGPYNPYTPEARIGVPVSPFPRWLRCPMCGRMGEVGSGLFELKADLHRPDRTKFVHSNCSKARGAPPSAVAARFLVACRDGHLDAFPWHYFVHGGPSDCPGPLKFFEQGASLQTENLWVSCERCNMARSMVDAFGDRGRKLMPQCRGRHPHIGRSDEGCEARLRPVLLGASNSWFPVTMSVLAIPTQASRVLQIVRDKWDLLKGITSREVLPVLIEALANGGLLPGIGAYSHDEIWRAIEDVRAGDNGNNDAPVDLKRPEYDALSSPNPPQNWPDFMVTRVEAPDPYKKEIDYVVLGERLREVNALIGFTRVEPPEEGRTDGQAPERAPLSRGQPTWVPATEVRGEGIFLRFNSARLADWMKRPAVIERQTSLMKGHRAYRAARKILPTDANFPGIVYVLLHSFAHVFIRELALESGYSAASVRERIYATGYGDAPEMAGILVYTAAPDSEGTLGGLVELGRPQNLGALIEQALERTRICASDPLCAEHVPTASDRSLHGAACHACSFVAETSCEAGNRYLDRSLLVPTLAGGDLAFFEVKSS
jgi:hypothetical protein